MVYININETKMINVGGVDVLYYEQDLPCVIPGTVVDIETTGLEPDEDYITAIGFVKWNKMSCFVISGGANCDESTVGDDYPDDIVEKFEKFRAWCKKKIKKSPKPYIAYNKFFEQKWLDIPFDLDIQPIAYQAKDRDINNYYGYKPAAIKIAHLGDTIDNASMIYADEFKIMKHLIQDMYAELALYVSNGHIYRREGGSILPV